MKYVIYCIRHNIVYTVGVLSKFTRKLDNEHWHAITRVVKYLIETKTCNLFYKKIMLYLKAFWSILKTLSRDSSSTTSYIFTLGGGAICWKSKKKAIIVNSTIEAEVIILAWASEEANWLRDLLIISNTFFWKLIPRILTYCYNTAAISRVQNRYYNNISKPIRRKHSNVRSYLASDTINVYHVKSWENLADHLTKALIGEKV